MQQQIDLDDIGKRKQSLCADFETAVTATGYGTFNYVLYFIAFLAMISNTFETTTMSYVFPAAECDLNLTLQDKGLLNACTYAGMITSAFIWGYVCDTFGRKKLLTIGFLLDGLCVVTGGLARSFPHLFAAKFLGGFIINGPFAALTAYISEFHCSKYRARVQILMGLFLCLGTLILPLLGLFILPLDYHLHITDYYTLHSWNFYLLICAIPPLTAGLLFAFFPESPKFLMTTGQNKKALETFQWVYRLNNGKAEECYPIKFLVEETTKTETKQTTTETIFNGFRQLKPMFRSPMVYKAILVFSMQFLIMNSLNTLRLWLPQLYQVINDHRGNDSATLCEMLDVFQPKNITKDNTCTVNMDNIPVYTNSIIVAIVGVITNAGAGTLVNAVGKKRIILTLAGLSGFMSLALYFSRNTPTTVALTSIFVGCGGVTVNVLLAVVVDLFPTTLRTMTVSLTMMFGRLGGMSGNIIFPFLLATGCGPAFIYVASLMIGCAILTLLLPNTDQKALE